MAYVQEYAPGRWRARKRIEGKLVSKSFSSRAEAWAWAEGEESPVVEPARVPAPASPGRPDVLMDSFLDGPGLVTLNVRESTQAFIQSIVRAHIRPRWGHWHLSQIQHRHVQEWIIDLSKTSLSPRTVHHIYKVMHRVMADAEKFGLIQANPCVSISLPRVDEEEMRFLNTSQVEALTDAMRDRYKAFVPLCAYGGLRIGEAFGLRWKRIDLFRGTVDIAEIVTEVNGRPVMGAPKTRAGRRTVSVPRVAVDALSDHRKRLGGNPGADAFVFGGDTPARTRSFRRWWWAPAVEEAGLTPLRPHDLRHTAVAMWIAAGASPKEVAVRAGHTSVSFTLDRYGHLFPSMDQALVERLNAVIDRGVK